MNSHSSAQGSATVSDPISPETIVNVQNKRQLKSYKCILEYSDVKSATERLKEEICESNYIFRYTRPNTDGFKDYYHCQNNQKCPKVLYLLRHNDSYDPQFGYQRALMFIVLNQVVHYLLKV